MRIKAAQQFTLISPYYDHLMRVVPYEKWLSFVLERALEEGIGSGRVLDLACGTGNFTALLEREGFEVVGVDISFEMAKVASQKGLKVAVQDARSLGLKGPFDLVTCVYDSLNYLLSFEDLVKAMREVGRVLRKGGLFIFDLNTEFALKAGFFDQSNLRANDWLHFKWRSAYDKGSRLCVVRMDFWVEEGGRKRHFREIHVQRAHSHEEVEEALKAGGMEIVGVFDDYTTRKAHIFTDRAVYVAKKVTDEDCQG